MQSSAGRGFIKEFLQNRKSRHLVLGTAQLCWDLCATLKLPPEVVATSLICLQKFFAIFRVNELERPLVCGACVLVTWKYWEDFLNIKSVRKLSDICRELFKLLVLQSDDFENNPSISRSAKRLKVEISTPYVEYKANENRTPPPSEPKEPNEENCSVPDEMMNSTAAAAAAAADDTKSDWLWGRPDKIFTATDWTLRDEGREFNRVRDKIKLYESCVIRCLDFEIGPFELPFPTIDFLCNYIWSLRQQTSSSLPSKGFASSNSTTEKNRFPTINLQAFQTSAYDNLSFNNSQKKNDKVFNNDAPAVYCRFPANYLSQYCRSDANVEAESLSRFLYLSHAFALDLFRTPFCLLSPPTAIGVAAVWKAAVTLRLYWPFENSLKTIFNSSSQDCEESELASLFPLPPKELQRLLRQFRLLYGWLSEFENSKSDFSHLNKDHKNT